MSLRSGRGHAPAFIDRGRLPVPQPKPSVSIIGAGRLGSALAIALSGSGYTINALVARTRRKAEQAARLVTNQPLPLTHKQLEQLPPGDLFIISTPDDAIEATAQKLAELRQLKSVALHTSGALSSSALEPLAKVGFSTGSLHPLVSVSEARAGAEALRGAFYCIEGDRKAQTIAKRIVADLDGHSFSMRAKDKALYHAAAVMASPHMTALFDVALQLLVECGLNRRVAQQVLLPLVQSTIDNLKTLEPRKALTGTFARGDVATVRRHLNALDKHGEARDLYRLLGLHSLKLAKRNKLDQNLIDEIQELLRHSSK